MSDRRPLNFIFQLPAKEASAFRLFIPALAILVLYRPIGWWIFPPVDPDFRIDVRMDSLLSNSEVVQPLRYFDPNTSTAEEWQSFGLDSSLASRIGRYREKGGRFRKPADLLRMYGMDTAVYHQLEPWVRIRPADSVPVPFQSRHPVRSPRPKPKTFDLNLADTSDFEALAGIGHKTAVRIMKYRAALGGFVSKQQLYEVWAIDSLAVFSMSDFFISPGFQPVRLNLNHAAEPQLDFHPYLNRIQAKAILFYRFQHGVFKSVGDLKKVRLLDSVTLRRIAPYVTVDPN